MSMSSTSNIASAGSTLDQLYKKHEEDVLELQAELMDEVVPALAGENGWSEEQRKMMESLVQDRGE